MAKTNDLYIGRKSRPFTCPVCMRTKEDAIAEQIQAGTSCGHERCEFKSEIELVSSILKAPNLEQLKTITSESIETSKKTYDLLLNLRESVRGMKDNFRNETEKDDAVTEKVVSSNLDYNRKIEISREQIKSIMDRIDLSIRTMSTLIEKGDGQQHSEEPPIIWEENEIEYGLDKDEEYRQFKKESIAQQKKRIVQQKEWDEYLSYREDYNRRLDQAFEKAHEALKGMQEVVEDMKDECTNEKASKSWNKSLSGMRIKLLRIFKHRE